MLCDVIPARTLNRSDIEETYNRAHLHFLMMFCRGWESALGLAKVGSCLEC